MKNKTIMATYAGILWLVSCISSIAFAIQPLVAVGTWSEKGLDKPLVAVSKNQGVTWSYPPSANLQPVTQNYSRGELTKVFCNNQRCVAAGYWMDNEAIFRPLLASSLDEGNTWNYLDMLHQSPLLPNPLYSKFHDITCAESFCIAAGKYTNTDNLTLPLLAHGQYQPEIVWHFLTENIQQHLPEDFYAGHFNQVSCNNHICVAAGEYSNQIRHRLPLLMQSDETGQNWQIPVMDFPTDFHEGNFQSINCNETLCLATGDYHNGRYNKPLLMKSIDQGTTWQSVSIVTPENYPEGTLMHASCEKQWCVAAGALIDVDLSRPFLVFSDNGGQQWQYSDYISNDGLPEAFVSGQLTYTACNALRCMAAGSYYDLSGSHPLIAVSADQGKTWSYPASAQQSSPAALSGDGMYAHAFCNQSLCLATGDFLEKTSWTELNPLLALSQDGQVWKYPESIYAPYNLPAGLQSGHFRSVG